MSRVHMGAGLSALLAAGVLGLVGAGPAAGAVSVMKQCGDDWKAAKSAGTTGGQTWPDFYKACKAKLDGAAAPAAAPAPVVATAPTPTPVKPAVLKPSPIKPAVAASGAGEFTAEAEAKGHCPSDTVVWVNTKSHKYHYAGHASYGTTKQGAYMCKADADAAGDIAAKGEKPKT